MLVKKKVLGLFPLEEESIDEIKEICCQHFINLLDDIYYTHSTDEKDLSDSVITCNKLFDKTEEISVDPNLIKFETDIPYERCVVDYRNEIKRSDDNREQKAKENYYILPSEEQEQCAGYGWRTIKMQLEDIQGDLSRRHDSIQIKVFTLGKKDYFCYIV